MQTTSNRVLPDLSTAFSKPTVAASATQPKAKPELSWETLDVNSLSPDLQDLYLSYKQAEEIATRARKVFETAMSLKLDIPSHLILRFGYRFGKLAVAIDTDQRAKPRTAALSLEGLAQMVNKR
jgi:hypothetical protein